MKTAETRPATAKHISSSPWICLALRALANEGRPGANRQEVAFTIVCNTKFLPMMVRSHYITEIMTKATDTAESQKGCGDKELSAPPCVCGTATPQVTSH